MYKISYNVPVFIKTSEAIAKSATISFAVLTGGIFLLALYYINKSRGMNYDFSLIATFGFLAFFGVWSLIMSLYFKKLNQQIKSIKRRYPGQPWRIEFLAFLKNDDSIKTYAAKKNWIVLIQIAVFALVLLSLLKFTLFSGLPPALAILSFAVFAAILKFGFGFNLDQLKTLAKNTRALLNFSKKKPVLKFEPSPLRPGTEWHLRIENLSTENANSEWNFRIRQFEQISRTIEKKTYRRRISYTIYESFIEADILVPKESVHRELNSCSFTIKDELSQSLYTSCPADQRLKIFRSKNDGAPENAHFCMLEVRKAPFGDPIFSFMLPVYSQ